MTYFILTLLYFALNPFKDTMSNKNLKPEILMITSPCNELTYQRKGIFGKYKFTQIRKRYLKFELFIKEDSIYTLPDSVFINELELVFIDSLGLKVAQKSFWSKKRVFSYKAVEAKKAIKNSYLICLKRKKGNKIFLKYRIKDIHKGKYKGLVGYDLRTGPYKMFLKFKPFENFEIYSNKLNLKVN